MRIKIYLLTLLGGITILSSCSNYGYISENDVYMQKPTEINLDEDENDLTSFNAFKAREKGAFRDEYYDPRVNQRVRLNQFMILNSYMPYGVSYSMFGNYPIRFHGMSMNDPFYYGYVGPAYGYGFSSGFGMGMYYDRFYNPYYGYGYGYYPYGYGYSYGHGYGYGYNGISGNQGNPSNNQPVHYGKRNSLTSSSNRSSSYPKSYTKQALPDQSSSYDVNDQTLGTSRREISRRHAGASEFSNNGKPNNTNFSNQGGVTNSMGISHQRVVNQNYTPNSSARRSGAVEVQRSLNMNSTRGVSGTQNSATPQRRTYSPVQSQPQSRGSFSTGNSSRSLSTPSTTRSSGSTNSNSGRR